jgi:hypothetical protein
MPWFSSGRLVCPSRFSGVVSVFSVRSLRLVVVLSLLLPAVARSQEISTPLAPLDAQVDLGVVTATGFEPGAEAVVFGVVRIPAGYVERVMPRAERLEADELGELVFEAVPAEILPEGETDIDPTALAVWVVIDPARGEYAVLTPDGSRARERPFSPRALQEGPSGLVDRLTQEMGEGHLLLVRPPGDETDTGATKEEGEPVAPAGVWALTLEDGSNFDLDGERDGSFEVTLSDWWPVGDGPEPPEEVQAGDLIFVIEPTTLEFSVVRFVGRGA